MKGPSVFFVRCLDFFKSAFSKKNSSESTGVDFWHQDLEDLKGIDENYYHEGMRTEDKYML